jgi:hypothetical protein
MSLNCFTYLTMTGIQFLVSSLPIGTPLPARIAFERIDDDNETSYEFVCHGQLL